MENRPRPGAPTAPHSRHHLVAGQNNAGRRAVDPFVADRLAVEPVAVAGRLDVDGTERGDVPSAPIGDCDVLGRADRPGGLQRDERLTALAERVERTLAHQLVGLAPLAWHGADADLAIERLQARLFELTIAAAGLRSAAALQGGPDRSDRSPRTPL